MSSAIVNRRRIRKLIDKAIKCSIGIGDVPGDVLRPEDDIYQHSDH